MSDQSTDFLFERLSRGEQVDAKEVFRYELNRLYSFVTWPRDANAYPTNLARTGLYYLGTADTVACFYCNVHLGQWESIDLPLGEHERHSPNCDFIKGNDVGNIPLVLANQVFSVQLLRQQEDEIRNERATAQSIGLPPAPGYVAGVDSNLLDMLQKQMADLSLKYPFSVVTNQLNIPGQALRPTPGSLSNPDMSLLDPPKAYQGLSVHGGSTTNNQCTSEPSEHQHLVMSTGGSVGSGTGSTECTGSTRQDLIQQAICSISTEAVRQGVTEYCPLDTLKTIMQSANHPQYAHINRRMESYDTWPYSHIQNPIRLAEAGFYYTEREDRIRCFLCNGGLCNWESEDIPWFEHCRWFERCRYALACKEHPVIKAIVETAEQLRPHQGSESETQCDDSPAAPEPEETSTGSSSLTQSDIAKLADMGFTQERIQAILQRRGNHNISIEQAIDALAANDSPPPALREPPSTLHVLVDRGATAGATSLPLKAGKLDDGNDIKDEDEGTKDDDASGRKKKKVPTATLR